MKILKAFSFSVIIAAGTVMFLWLTFLALCNFTALSNKASMDIVIYITAAGIFSFILWLLGGFNWVRKLFY